MRVGVLALQGDYQAHGAMLSLCGASPVWVRRADDLSRVDALVIPGGESTTLLKFLARDGFLEALRALPLQGKPVLGTCAGAILLAAEVTHPGQPSLGLMDITVERNAYGRQLSSRVVEGAVRGRSDGVEMVFIRAPRITRVGPEVEVVAESNGDPVCVRQGLCVAATFHPELGRDTWLHELFLGLVDPAPPPPGSVLPVEQQA